METRRLFILVIIFCFDPSDWGCRSHLCRTLLSFCSTRWICSLSHRADYFSSLLHKLGCHLLPNRSFLGLALHPQHTLPHISAYLCTHKYQNHAFCLGRNCQYIFLWVTLKLLIMWIVNFHRICHRSSVPSLFCLLSTIWVLRRFFFH